MLLQRRMQGLYGMCHLVLSKLCRRQGVQQLRKHARHLLALRRHAVSWETVRVRQKVDELLWLWLRAAVAA